MTSVNFSVVIPLFNKAPHIKDTIDSVLSQTRKDYEVIVVDDSSTDGSGDMVAGIIDPRIRLVRHSNAGVSASRNKGIELAQGEYIAFLDGDDLWLPNHLEVLVHLIRIYPNCGMYATSYKILRDDDTYQEACPDFGAKGQHIYLDLNGYLNFAIHHSTFWTGTICIPKPIFSKVGKFEIGLARGEDQDMWLRVAAYSPVAFINEITAIYNTAAVNRSPERWSPEKNIGLINHAEMIRNDAFTRDTQKKLYE